MWMNGATTGLTRVMKRGRDRGLSGPDTGEYRSVRGGSRRYYLGDARPTVTGLLQPPSTSTVVFVAQMVDAARKWVLDLWGPGAEPRSHPNPECLLLANSRFTRGWNSRQRLVSVQRVARTLPSHKQPIPNRLRNLLLRHPQQLGIYFKIMLTKKR